MLYIYNIHVKMKRHSVFKHNFFYVPQYGEQPREDTQNVIAPLKRKRVKEMQGGEGKNTMEQYDHLAGKNIGSFTYRWLSNSCVRCLERRLSQVH